MFASWTLWFNVLAGVYEVLANTGVIANLPSEVSSIVLIIGNILLRFRTTQGVHVL